MTIAIECPFCGQVTFIETTAEAIRAYENGALAQDAFPHLSVEDRETIISGLCWECQDNVFGDEEDEDEDFYEPADLEMDFNPYLGCYDWE